MKTPIQFRLNGEDVAAFVEGGANLLDMLREVGRRSLGQGRLLARHLRHLHGAGRWIAARLSCLTLAESLRRQLDRNHRRAAPRRRSASAANRIHGALRRPVRLLHAGHADGGQSAARPAIRTRRVKTSSMPSAATSAAAPAMSRSSMRCSMPRAATAAAAPEGQAPCSNFARTSSPTNATTICTRSASRRSGRTCSGMSPVRRPTMTIIASPTCCI